jgi:hypothetical protein
MPSAKTVPHVKLLYGVCGFTVHNQAPFFGKMRASLCANTANLRICERQQVNRSSVIL